MKTVQQKYRKRKEIRHRSRAHANVALPLNLFIKNSRGICLVFGTIIMLATAVAASLAAVTWEKSLVYSFMAIEDLQIIDMHFYEGQDSKFSGLPEVHITGTGEYVIIEESSDITISGSSNNVIVVGGTHNIQLLGGHNNLTLLNSGKILIDVTNPNVSLTQVPGGWIVQAIHPTGRPVIRGDIYLNTLGSPTNTVYIRESQVIQCDDSYSGLAVTVRNTGTCPATITGVSLQGVVCAQGIPVPCTVPQNSEATISISFTWISCTIYRVSLFTSKANVFTFSEIAW